jgi:hypothetical protein
LAWLLISGYSATAQGVKTVNSTTPGELEAAIQNYNRRNLLAAYDLPAFTTTDADNKTVRADVAYLRRCVDYTNEKFNKKLGGVLFNPKTLDDNFINIIFIDKDPDNLFRQFWRNCTFTGYKNTIVCDISYLYELAVLERNPKPDKADNDESKQFAEMIRGYRACICLWVLGHEIGHLAHGHTKRHYAFRSEDSDVIIHNVDGRPKGLDLQAEQQADDFVYKVFELDGKNGLAFFLWMGTNQAVQTSAVRTLEAQGLKAEDIKPKSVWWVTEQKYNIVTHSRTHPPMFVRVVDIGRRLSDELGVDNTGFYAKIRQNITVKYAGE